MANKYLFKLVPLALAAALVACGGSDGDSGNTPAPQPPIVQAPFKMEILAGSTGVNFNQCAGRESLGHLIIHARFRHLERIATHGDQIFLTDSGEGCETRNHSSIGPVIHSIEFAWVRFFASFWRTVSPPFGAINESASTMFVNSFYRRDKGGFVVLSYGAASSETGFELNESLLADYTQRQIWKNFGLGVFSRAEDRGGERLVAGAPGQPPGYADGMGQAARFTAPHDLEGDADGLLYLIDAGRIRTVDQKDWQVRTLDNVALGATGVFKTLDSDRLGRVHAIDRKSTRLNSSHTTISYAVFCLKKKNTADWFS